MFLSIEFYVIFLGCATEVFLPWQAAGQRAILEHIVRVNADHFTPVGQDLIPTGYFLIFQFFTPTVESVIILDMRCCFKVSKIYVM